METLSILFGNRIKSFRMQKKLSQEKLAEYSRLHATYIGQIERGEKSPTVDTVYKLSKGLGVSASEFFKNPAAPDSPTETADKIYNEVLKLSQDKQEKVYKILKEIISL